MIDNEEIDSKAIDLGVHTSHIQRDYVFGWLLAGLYQASGRLSDKLILKGGNAFRKAYFEHARYSNDLDFCTQQQVDEDHLEKALEQACDFAADMSGVEFEVADTKIGSRTADGARLFEARIYFRSFYGQEDVRLRVDLDVKEFETIVLPIQSRNLVHSYSDAAECTCPIRVQKLEELLASKLVAMLKRQHSPDLFDFVHSIFFQNALAVDRREIVTTFLRKTIYEPSPQVARGLLLDLPFSVLRGLWDKYVVCPKPVLIDFDGAEERFKAGIAELFDLIAPQPRYAPAGFATPSHFLGGVRNTLLEAGRLQRVLELVYDGVARRVEPYALAYKRRRDGVGHEYFYGWDLTGGRSGSTGIKSFFPEKVRSVRMTEDQFDPRFPIEMGKTGVGYFGSPIFKAQTRGVGYRSKASTGPVYVIACTVCEKHFRRKTRNTHLNEHKDKYGNRCYGRVGVFVSNY